MGLSVAAREHERAQVEPNLLDRDATEPSLAHWVTELGSILLVSSPILLPSLAFPFGKGTLSKTLYMNSTTKIIKGHVEKMLRKCLFWLKTPVLRFITILL